MKKFLSIILAIILTFSLVACGGNGTDTTKEDPNITSTSAPEESTVIGTGETSFVFNVVDTEGKETSFEVHTDKETVGEALTDCELIAGENGPYGLYVKTVNGVTLDYDKDGKYWAFYIGDELAPTGVDSTIITEGSVYSFKAE